MKVQDLLDMIAETPEIAQYDLCLSAFFSIPDSCLSDNEQPDEEDIQVVADFPIKAITANDDSKEIRFVMSQSDFSAIEQCPDRILKILKEKRNET